MPSRIVVVHDDQEFGASIGAALNAAGYEVTRFPDSMSAIMALDAAQSIELLITGIGFPKGTPHGVTLARMARVKKTGAQVLFVAREEYREDAEGVGEFLAMPARVVDIVATAERMLAPKPVLRSHGCTPMQLVKPIAVWLTDWVRKTTVHDPEQAIREAAYSIWEREGRPEGRADEHWYRAVAEIDPAPLDEQPNGDETDPAKIDPPAVPTKDASVG